MKKILLAFCTIALLASCDQVAPEQSVHPGTEGMAVSIREATIPPMGNLGDKSEYIQFTVSSEVAWKIERNGADWLLFDFNGKPSSTLKGAAGTTNVAMYAPVNTESESYRTAKVDFIFSDASKSVATIDVYQERPYLRIKAADQTLEEPESIHNFLFHWDESEDQVTDAEQSITIYSNTPWKISLGENARTYLCQEGLEPFDGKATVNAIGQNGILIGPTDNQWLVCSQIEGDTTGDLRAGDNGVNVKFNPLRYNTTRNDRTLNIVVSGQNKLWQTMYLNFVQENLIFVATLDGADVADKDAQDNIPTVIKYPACNTTTIAQHQFTVESELDWILNDNNSTWVVATPKEGYGSGVDGQGLVTPGTINLIENDANPGSEVREEILTFISQADVNPKPSLYIKVEQEGYIFELNPSTLNISNNDLTEREIQFMSSGHWEVDKASVPEWITVSGGEGIGLEYGAQGVERFNINANCQNLLLTDRSQNIVVKSTQPGNNMAKSISVTQDKYIFDATSLDSDLQFGTDESVNAPATLDIHSSGDWEISIKYPDSYNQNLDWLECEKYSGNGNAKITYWAKSVNGDIDNDRMATIVVTSSTHKNAGAPIDDIEINIKQRKFTFNITANSPISYYAVDSSSNNVAIDCSVAWQVDASESWVKLNRVSGTSNTKSLSVTVENNLSLSPRQATVTISNIDPAYGEHTKSFTIEQKGFVFNVSGTTEYNNLSPINATGNYEVQVTCSGAWSVKPAEAWVTASPSSGNGGNPEAAKSVHFTVADNPNLSTRSTSVTISSNLNSQYSKSVTFSQNAFEFNNTPKSFSFDAINSKSEKIDIVCSGNWVLDGYESWMGADKTSGSGNTTITITPTTNTNKGTGRMNRVLKVVSSLHKNIGWSDMASVTKVINISQNGLQFDDTPVTVPPFKAISPSSYTASIGLCDGGWEIKSVPSWVTVTPTSGTSYQSIMITPSENTSMQMREATIEVVSKLNSSLKKVISLSQAAFVFDTKDASVEFEATDTAANAKKVTVDASSAGWTLVCTQTWLTVSPTVSFDGAKTEITITPTENKDTKSRTATITITSDKNSSLTKTITVTQKAATPPPTEDDDKKPSTSSL